MGFLKKLFSRRSNGIPEEQRVPTGQEAIPTPSPQESASQAAQDGSMIRVFDRYGRELMLTREQWRDNVLQGTIAKCWDSADELAPLIIQAFGDGFFNEMVKPAERLRQLEPDAERSAVLLAIACLRTGQLHDSERALDEYIGRNGETGVVLTNLAKVYAERGDNDRALDTLWRGLKLDPNQDNAVAWYEAIRREQGGESAGHDALRSLSELPGSWRAQLWLARAELAAGNVDAALALYRDSLAKAPRPVPADLLMQASGDLGNAGCLRQIPDMIEPWFVPAIHGLAVGNNLLKVNIELGKFGDAARVLNQLYALKRPDWNATLDFWDAELAKARLNQTDVPDEGATEMALLAIEGVIWLREEGAEARLFPTGGAADVTVALLGSTVEVARPPERIEKQLADAPGRISRAVPLFLAEQLSLRCAATTRTLVPWIQRGGFALIGRAWTDAEALGAVRQGDQPVDYVAICHLVANAEPWQLEVRLVRVSDSRCVGQLSQPFSPAAPAFTELATQLVQLLCTSTGVAGKALPDEYALPAGADLPQYLVCLEQLLSARCAGMADVERPFLHGERNIIQGGIALCASAPHSVNVRLLLVATLRAMKRVRPDVLPEFSDRVAALQKAHPLDDVAQGLVQQLFDEAFAVS